MNVYGYCRISTQKQNIERQVRNILSYDSTAHIIREIFTGTKFQGRTELDKLIKQVKKSSNSTIIFDSVSRMSRNSDDGITLYEDLYNAGVNLVFLKEPHINSEVYRNALRNQIALTGGNVDRILAGVNEYLLLLAREQVKISFEQAQKEVLDLRQRTREGLVTAKLNGKQVGLKKGTRLTTKKSIEAKKKIKKYNKSFNGALNNEETWKLIGISKMSFYKYKSEMV